MSTDTELEEQIDVEELSEVESVAVRSDDALDPDEHAVAVAENEGMVGITHPIPEAKVEDDGLRVAIDLKMVELGQERSKGIDLEEREADAADEHKRAKKAREAQDEVIKETIDALMALYRNEPDPKRYPLLDRAAPTADFPAPIAIQPLPADDEQEFFRRKKRDTRLDSLKLKPKCVEILEAENIRTVADLDPIYQRDRGIRGIKNAAGSITEDRSEHIADVLNEVTLGWLKEWNEAHPAEAVAEAETPNEEGAEDAG